MSAVGRFYTKVGKVLHKPAMLSEVISILNPKANELFLDCTFGAGGHTKGLLAAVTSLTVFALDRDPLAIGLANQLSQELVDKKNCKVVPLFGKFSDLPKLLNEHGVRENSLDGLLIDTGCSSMQFDSAQRGFSISGDGLLDMRMSQSPEDISAFDVVNFFDETELAEIFDKYGEERKAKRIAKSIVEARMERGAIRTTKQLANIIAEGVEGWRKDSLGNYTHMATKVFQAIRIFVNDELNELSFAVEIAHKFLKPQTGRAVVITFHSLEDRIVKRHFLNIPMEEPFCMTLADQRRKSIEERQNDSCLRQRWEVINRKILTPTEEEIKENPRVRSARLRAAVKIQ